MSLLDKIIPKVNRIIAAEYIEYENIKNSMSTFADKLKDRRIVLRFRISRHAFQRNTTILEKAFVFNIAKRLVDEEDRILLELIDEIGIRDEFNALISIPHDQLSIANDLDLNRIRYSLGTIELTEEIGDNAERGEVYAIKHITIFHFRDMPIFDDMGNVISATNELE